MLSSFFRLIRLFAVVFSILVTPVYVMSDVVALRERLEQPRQQLGADPDAGIRDRDDVAGRVTTEIDHHRAAHGRELHRVR